MDKSFSLYIAIGIGGMIGATSRYCLSLFIGFHEGFPTSTLIINLIGCFLLGYLLHANIIKKTLSPSLRIALTTGVIGSFTTFSTVAIETIELFQQHLSLAIIYVLLSIIGGILLSYSGYNMASTNKVSQ